MKRPLGILLLAGLALIASSCDPAESTRTKPVAKPPATQPAAVPATTQAAKRPTIPIFIGGESFDFPVAKLRLTSKDGAIVADLYSDDPKEAIEDNYTGNSFYLVMSLEGDDPKTLGDCTWVYKAASGTTRTETTTGIFLHGTKYRLQPYEVIVRVLPAGPAAKVSIQGQFLRFDTRQDGLPTTMAVEADLKATVEYK